MMFGKRMDRNRPSWAPKARFPGGHIQIINPHLPIASIWCDLLFLKPNKDIPAHKHTRVDSLLICLAGNGMVSVGKRRIRLHKGVCVHIPAKAVHRVWSSRRHSLNCLSVNQGIIDTKTGVDISFANRPNKRDRQAWQKFDEDSVQKAKLFKRAIKAASAAGNMVFRLNL